MRATDLKRSKKRFFGDGDFLSKKFLKQGDLAHVNGDQQRFLYNLVVTFVHVHPAFGWDDDALHVPIVRGVVESGRAAKNIHRVR